ncbi:MAG: penicillin-binding protein 1A [Methylotenera sp.]|nr:MAG: penicillin-binding protein 1A [Methylotenera sp.]
MVPKKWWHFLILFILVGGLTVSAMAALAVTLIYPTLPSLDALTNYKPKLPLRVYSADGFLISEFGEERRAFVSIDKVPQNLKDAVLAIEDRRFYQHGGVDTKGILRAIKNNVTGKSHEGASTITMQVAKNFFTTPGNKRTMVTKVKEALLALKIEKTLSKDQILELYLNQIYLGQRSYGFAAASQVYYGKSLSKLTLAESALLAGLPKAPSGYNPFTHLKRATSRQHEVLRDMRRYGFIDEAEFNAAMQQKLTFKTSKQARDLSADYVAEIVRQSLYERYQDEIYSSGLKVYTTIKKSNQEAANSAVTQGILEYQSRQGYQKPEKTIDLNKLQSADLAEGLQTALEDIEEYNGFVPAVVLEVSAKLVKVFSKKNEVLEISGTGLSVLKKNLADKVVKNHKIKAGSVVRIIKSQGVWHIVQLPQVEAALVALDPANGAITALVGGFDFNKNKFNHVTQAWRQPGSSFKPFVYSAALEKGLTPASIIEDEPFAMTAEEVGGNKAWEPKNYDGQFSGPMRLRTALTKSKNMVSIRVIEQIGTRYAQDYITKFGFSRKDHPAYLTMALGAGAATPWGMANGYAVFANGGFRVKPHLISKITDSNGNIIEQTRYPVAGQDAPRVIDGRNAFLMTSMMHDVVQRGTATKARQLGRQDLAGKTGTTNNQVDAWFAGYNPRQVAVAWIGFDQPRSLGRDETGGKAALPIWISYMATALKGMPDNPVKIPDGVMTVKINPDTGVLVGEDEDGINEYFYHENPPPTAEIALPPMEEPDVSSFPENMINPLQWQPEPINPAPNNQDKQNEPAIKPMRDSAQDTKAANKPKPVAKPASTVGGSDAAAQMLSPSRY